ncbi:MAG: Holliday junction branch migration protein RuvA [Clostridia bacterium]|nr:Holliday junction branch migration protein RuvA [Clostridia bacterium]
MFYHVKGELMLCEGSLAVVDCGGVGYALTVSLNTAEKLAQKVSEEVFLFTHLAVREDGVELYGFGSREELSVFRLLITVSGVGPKAAMSILSTLTPDRFAYAVCTEDAKALSRAPGIGGKTAARIVLELKDKISKEQMSGDLASLSGSTPAPKAPVGGAASGKLAEAQDALGVLGYNRTEIAQVLREIDVTGLSLEQIITAALRRFSEK